MKHKNSILASIWLLVVLLLILLMTSGALLAALIQGYVAGEKNVVPLYPGGDPLDNAFIQEYLENARDPDFQAHDDKVRWETNTSVDIFKTAYTNANGQVSVESALGDKVIAPGTENAYEFNLKNTGNISLDFRLTLSGVFQLKHKDLPVLVRLRSGDRWILGGQDSWCTVEELETVTENGTLEHGKSTGYILEWMWPFERGNDLEDTLLANDRQDTELGNTALEADADFHLNIMVESTLTPGAIAVMEDGRTALEEVLTKLNNQYLIFLGVLFLLSGIWLIFLLLWRNRIVVAGFVTAVPGSTMQWKKKQAALNLSGAFLFHKIPAGKHTFTLTAAGVQQGQLSWKLKRSRKITGVSIQPDGTVTVGRKIRALELHLIAAGPVMTLDPLNWAAIDSKAQVRTPLGIKPPESDGSNVTPGGLEVVKGRYGIREGIHV